MNLLRLAQLLPALRTALALILVPVLLVACNSGGTFGRAPAHIRVFNALVDGGPVTLTVYTEAVVTNVPFEGISGYQNVDAGNREVKITVAGSTSTLYDQTTLIVDASSYTYVVHGTTAAPVVQVLTDAVVQDQLPDAGMFRLRAINAAAGTAGLDVYVTQPGASLANLSPNFSNVAYGTTSTFATFAVAGLQVRFTLPNSKQVIYDAGTITFRDRTVYEVVGYTRGSSTLVNGALLLVDTAGSGSIVNSLLAQLKLVHAAPGTDAINASVDGSVAFANVPYQGASGYEGQLSGTHTVTVETITSPGAVIASARPPFVPATDTTIVVAGLPGAQQAVVLSDMNLPGTTGSARVRFVNVAADTGAVDVLVNFARAVSALGTNAASAYIEAVDGTYTITFDVAGTTNMITSVPSVELIAGRTYTMHLVGTAGQYGTILTRDD